MIVVTGGAGFIGSALIAELNRRGQTDILVVDELGTSTSWKNLRALSFSDYMEKGDFLDLVIDGHVPEGIDTVLHMGACSSTTQMDMSFLVQNNFEYTKWLAAWCVSSEVRFIYASSAATYGAGERGFQDDESQIQTLIPLNPYGYSKQLMDLWARRAGFSDKIVGLKYFNVFGPNEYHKADMRSYVLKGFEQIQATGKVKLFKSGDPDYADGEYVRDFVYVKDAVDMTLFFMDHPEANGLFNVGTGQARTWHDYVEAIFAAMDRTPDIEFVDMPDTIRDQYQYYTQASMTKLRGIGYTAPPTSLEEAVKDYVQNYLITGRYLGES
ncbi:MAG: ADP-glyceromanno-heptose 6-epimerase [Planctomycetes bacterium]|nr:ADP-glyceromanno-heptose 6-epimerase [Planctomycetota bacterium]